MFSWLSFPHRGIVSGLEFKVTLNRRGFLGGLAIFPMIPHTILAQEAKTWSYEGPEGPDKWAELDPANQICASGLEQSPVDLSKYYIAAVEPMSFNWQPQPFTIVNNGRSVYANVAKGSSTKFGSDEYALKQIVFHLPSEHSVDGTRQAMEIQFVHSQGPKRILIVSILVRAGARNDVFFAMMAKAPGKLGTQALQAPVDPNALLPASRSLFRYRGSLTMPPCTENVDWAVFAEPIEVAQADIDVFKLIFSMNARPVEPINRRFLLKGVL
jgi:carbonic anhydrase